MPFDAQPHRSTAEVVVDTSGSFDDIDLVAILEGLIILRLSYTTGIVVD
jgi:hypothetical protein